MLEPAPHIEFFTARDGYPIAVRVWDVARPKGDVVILHGIVSHGGWYLSSGAHLAAAGFRVHMPDRRGSGLNPLQRGDVGEFWVWLRDVGDYLRRLSPRRPRILIGISWGGTLAAAVARWRPQLFEGLGLICPGLCSSKAPGRLRRTTVQLLARTGARKRRVPIPLRDPALFTGVASQQAYIATDPLALRAITLSFAAATTELVRYATTRPEEIRTPTLLMLGSDDPITRNAPTRDFWKRIDQPKKRLVEYPGAGHTLEFEPDPAPYFADLTAWCESIATSSALPETITVSGDMKIGSHTGEDTVRELST